jgi:branched-chain amino acid transport system substrate-binding protein
MKLLNGELRCLTLRDRASTVMMLRSVRLTILALAIVVSCGGIFGKLILKSWPNAKIAMLYPNDEFGREYLAGLRSGLGDKADTRIVKVATYEDLSPAIDTQVAQLSSSGADLFLNASAYENSSEDYNLIRHLQM